MKKILLSALVSTVMVGSTLANTNCSAFNGFYLGGGLDYAKEKFKFTPNNGGSNTTINSNGGGVKFFTGYGAAISQGLYLGGELTLGYDRLVGDKNKGAKGSKRLNYGAAVRLGYVVSNALPYLKAGYEGRPDVGGVKRSGFTLGGGVDFAITKNVFIRGEYVHGFGGKTNNATLITPTAIVSGKVQTSSDTFLIGAGYKF